jgi:AcrR family transcriptional regulator
MGETVSSTARRWPVQKRSQERLERVLRIAEGLIVERGFANLNMKELAEIAKVNISTIYTYFPNSQSLLRILALRFIDELRREETSLVDKLAALNSPESLVDGFIDLAIEFYRSHPSYIAIWRGMQSDSELVAMDIHDTRATGRALAPLFRQINPAVGEDAELTAMILTAMTGAAIRLASELNVREREAAIHQFHLLARRMLIF